MFTYKLNSITKITDVFSMLNVTSIKPEVAIYDIQRMHLKHVNKKDFSPIIYNIDSTEYGKMKIVIKFKNNDFYDTTVGLEADGITGELHNALLGLNK